MRGSRPADNLGRAEKARLHIDPVACDGIGMCAHLAAGIIHLDPWGYPVIPSTDLEGSDRRAAVRAERGCPRRALRLSIE
ncbi:ferredoxin [Nakamurella sp. UYEF19]|uniref:ferredoxin n=1 Tax=Nakamurella sp. UYEF19 TaxID=1756392 RepID=UPI003391FA5A